MIRVEYTFGAYQLKVFGVVVYVAAFRGTVEDTAASLRERLTMVLIDAYEEGRKSRT